MEEHKTITEVKEWMNKNRYKKKFIAKLIGIRKESFYQILGGKYVPSESVLNLMGYMIKGWKPKAEERHLAVFGIKKKEKCLQKN